VLDLRFINKIRETGGKESLTGLVNLYLTDQELIFRQIRTALAERDPPRLQDRAHALRGCSIGLGAVAVGALCRDIELVSAAGNWVEVANLVLKLEIEALSVDSELRFEISK